MFTYSILVFGEKGDSQLFLAGDVNKVINVLKVFYARYNQEMPFRIDAIIERAKKEEVVIKIGPCRIKINFTRINGFSLKENKLVLGECDLCNGEIVVTNEIMSDRSPSASVAGYVGQCLDCGHEYESVENYDEWYWKLNEEVDSRKIVSVITDLREELKECRKQIKSQ